MSATQQDSGQPALVEPLIPAFKVGATTGLGGFLVGGAVGILRSAHPAIAGLLTGTQFFVLGSSFSYSRDVLLQTVFTKRTKSSELVSSTAAGTISGAAAGRFYGRINSAGGAVILGVCAHLGQRYIHSRADVESKPRDNRPYLDRLADSKWFPFRSLSNSEYETMLTEKLLKVDAEIMMIDEKVSALRKDTTESITTSEKS